mgnify:CR=1 FL=1
MSKIKIKTLDMSVAIWGYATTEFEVLKKELEKSGKYRKIWCIGDLKQLILRNY